MDKTWNIADRVECQRLRQGLSKSELARRAELNPVHLYKILKGKRPRVEAATVTSLALALNVTTDYLLGMDRFEQDADAV